MMFVVRFTDHPDRLHVRAEHQQAHLAWLAQNEHVILLGGPMRPDPEGPPSGALWIVEAEDIAAVHAWMAGDPFLVHGLRASVEVHAWRKVVPHGPRTFE